MKNFKLLIKTTEETYNAVKPSNINKNNSNKEINRVFDAIVSDTTNKNLHYYS